MMRWVALWMAPLLAAGAVNAAPSMLRSTPDSTLTPVHSRPAQVSGCRLVGKAFGDIEAGGEIVFKGKHFEVSESHASPNSIVYSGSEVRAVFSPRRSNAIIEGDSGVPSGAGPDVPGTLRIEIDGSVIMTNAHEHCVLFE